MIVHPSTIIKGSCDISKGVKIGANTIIDNSNLDGRGKLVIGENCIINRATIITAQHNIDSIEYETTYAPVNIGDYVIMYEKSLVLPGRNIGFGSVVAAGAVVTKDVPPMSVVAGNPARVIRKRLNIHTDCDIKALAGIVFMKHMKELFRR